MDKVLVGGGGIEVEKIVSHCVVLMDSHRLLILA